MKKHHLLNAVVLAILSLFFAQISFGEAVQMKTKESAHKIENKVDPNKVNPGELLKAHKNCRKEIAQTKKKCNRKKGNELLKCKSELMGKDESCANQIPKKKKHS